MPRTREQEDALLDWVNTFRIGPKVRSLADLTDGVVLSKILGDFDPHYAVHDIEQSTIPSKWLGKKKALEAVYKSLLRYIRSQCEDFDGLALHDPIDIGAIAEHDDQQQTIQLLTIFVLAALKGPKNDSYAAALQAGLTEQAQVHIMKLISNLAAETSKFEGDIATASLPPQVSRDFELVLEEENVQLRKEYENLKKTAADLITRNDHLKDNYDQLLEDKKQVDREYELLQKSGGTDRDAYIHTLKSQIQENETLIAEQENQLEDARLIKEKDQKELGKLRAIGEKAQSAEDELAAAKIQIVQLSKKANTVDHYQQKLQLLKTADEENTRLRQQIQVLESNQKDYDEKYHLNEKYKSANKELTERFHAGEKEIVDLGREKRALQEDLRARDEKIESLEARKHHDEEFIKDLQTQLQTSVGTVRSPDSPSTTHGRGEEGFKSLEDELNQVESSTPNYELENSRLRAEVQLLKSNTAGLTNAQLRVDLENEQKARKELQDELQLIREKYTIAQEQLDVVITEHSAASGEKDEAVSSVRKLYNERDEETKLIKQKLDEAQADITSRDRQLLQARTDLSVLDKEEADALEDLKATNETITSSLETDLTLLRGKYDALIADYESQNAQLAEAQDELSRLLAAEKKEKPADLEAENVRKSKEVSKDEDDGQKPELGPDQVGPVPGNAKKKGFWKGLLSPKPRREPKDKKSLFKWHLQASRKGGDFVYQPSPGATPSRSYEPSPRPSAIGSTYLHVVNPLADQRERPVSLLPEDEELEREREALGIHRPKISPTSAPLQPPAARSIQGRRRQGEGPWETVNLD